MMLPGAFLFDLDGVITDTARCHFTAWKALSDKLGLDFDEQVNQLLKGVSRRRSFEIILEHNGKAGAYSEAEMEALIYEKNQLYVAQITTLTPADILPGIPAFLAAARERGITMAVASASRNAPAVLERLGLTDAFDYVADAGKIARPKPDPEVFLDCAAYLGVEPGLCVGFEDSQAGIEAIHSAGMLSVGIGVEVVTRTPDLPLEGTGALDLTRICAFFSQRKGE